MRETEERILPPARQGLVRVVPPRAAHLSQFLRTPNTRSIASPEQGIAVSISTRHRSCIALLSGSRVRRRLLQARCRRAFTTPTSVATAPAVSSSVMPSYSTRINISRRSDGRVCYPLCKAASIDGESSNATSSSSEVQRPPALQRFNVRLRAIPGSHGRISPRVPSYRLGVFKT